LDGDGRRGLNATADDLPGGAQRECRGGKPGADGNGPANGLSSMTCPLSQQPWKCQP